LFTILVLGESIAAVVAGLGHTAWALPPTFTAALGVGITTALWWLYFDNARGAVVRRDASVRRTWRPTVWIYTHLPLAAALAASSVAMERAVSDAGHGVMPTADRLLLVGSVSAVLASLALIQKASTAEGTIQSRSVIMSRLIGIPFLLAIGFLASLEPQWVATGVLGVCVAEIISDMTAGGQVGRDRGLP
jgi:low temperature requirement protein LtrA